MHVAIILPNYDEHATPDGVRAVAEAAEELGFSRSSLDCYTKRLADSTRRRRIAVCDGGITDLIRPALDGARYPIRLVEVAARPRGPVDVVGPVCASGNFVSAARSCRCPSPAIWWPSAGPARAAASGPRRTTPAPLR